MQDSSSQSSSVTESMQQLNISEPQEREAVVNRGTSGLKLVECLFPVENLFSVSKKQ